jgi:predicted nucleotidyltransferase
LEKDLTHIIDEFVNKIIACSDPVKIILFGSAARGTYTQNSDLDFLVVVKDGVHRRNTAHTIYNNITDINYSADIIVATEEDLITYKDSEWNVISPAVKEGKTVYAA